MIPLNSPKLLDNTAFQAESDRVYDICNGCRRCFNLCPSFDVLFRGIDDKDGEVKAIEQPILNQVVDLCYYCKLCFNHCPYCPPHHYDLDFPRLMLWGKNLRLLPLYLIPTGQPVGIDFAISHLDKKSYKG